MKLIIGIDPGTNVGLVAFDLEKNLVLIKTLRRAGKKEIIKEIEKIGEPIVICTDVTNPPNIIKIVASYFNSKIYSPEKELKSLDKAKIYDEFIKENWEKIKIKKINLHERDAIISVIKFFKKIDNKLRWINRIIKEKNLQEFEEKIKCEVIKGKQIAQVIRNLK